MTDQVSTPGSNGDSSINVGKTGAPKDRSCPFCHQAFTSSSLGRHLDLYIKEKNPKPPDGVHNVDEIRKLRGGITRRQPRNLASRREGSTPGGTPAVNGEVNGKRSPQSGAGPRNNRGDDAKSPTIRRKPTDLNVGGGKGMIRNTWHRASWQATGVINDIPPITQNGTSGDWDKEGNGGMVDKTPVDSRRVVSRQILAKKTFDQKQKMTEALDSARAAELALREVLGSIRAANRRVKPSATPFDYDPLTLDFPALALHCLLPPPTLNQVAPIPTPGCWSINPPDKMQYEALHAHFREAFHSWRISRVVTSQSNPDEMLLYSEVASSTDDETEIQAAAQDLQEKISNHLNAAFSHWSSMAPVTRADNWRLQLAKAVGHKDHTISSLKSDRDKILQENAHLRAQVEQLSMCQQPREFQIMPPSTLPISSRAAVEIGKIAARGGGIGLNVSDKNETIDGLVKTAMGRWLNVVKSSKANSGMASQRPLDQPIAIGLRSQQSIGQIQNQMHSNNVKRNTEEDRDGDMDLVADADADADADVEGEETYEVSNSITIHGQTNERAPEAPMGVMSSSYGGHDRTNRNISSDIDGPNGHYCGNRILF